jgi:Enoyl-CoA hydratase/isomerase
MPPSPTGISRHDTPNHIQDPDDIGFIQGRSMSTPKANIVLQTRQTLPKSGKDVIIVSLNRPDRLNCFNTAVCDELSKIISEIKADDDTLAAVIFTGEGTSFCAGADLSDPPNAVLQSSDIVPSSVQNPVDYLTNLPVPVIAALKGHVSDITMLVLIRKAMIVLALVSPRLMINF